MANNHGGYRPGAGAVPRDLDAVIDYRPVRHADGTIEQQPVTFAERIIEAISLGGFLHDAAARVGITVETLREWRRVGNKARHDVLTGTKRRSHLTKRERQLAELAANLELAESEARLRLLGIGQKLAQGGTQRTETTVETIAPTGGTPQLVRTTERTYVAEPSAQMVTWLLGHRWPADFGTTRTEITGPDGGPIQVGAAPALDRLRDVIETAKHPTPNGHQPPTTHTNGSNGHTG